MKTTNLSIASFILTLAVLSGCNSSSSKQARSTSDPHSAMPSPSQQLTADTERPGLPPDGFAGGPGGNARPGNKGSQDRPAGSPPGAPAGGMVSQPNTYDAKASYSSDKTVSGKTISSSGKDENAVLVTNGACVTLSEDTITRKSASSTGGDAASFYGVGAATLVTDGKLYIDDNSITTDAKGGAGVFAYGDGEAYIAYSTITTKKDTSGGIHAAGGGKVYAWNLDVETRGESSAAIRSDRGGGTMVIDGGKYTSKGIGSPAIYSTANIAVKNASLTATGSEAICIEGLNSIRLFDCDLSGNMSEQDQNDCTWNVILYQSMSGDSKIGNSTFEMQGGKLTAKNGGMFYSTNTESTFILKDVEIDYSTGSEFFLKVTGNTNKRGWGTSGANGADTKFTAIHQEMDGDVIYDSISTLNFYMTEGSTLRGKFIDDEKAAGKGGDGSANLFIDSKSRWTVTGNSTLTKLSCSGTIIDTNGKTVSIVDTSGKSYVTGDSKYTITVQSYDMTGSVSSASSTSSWDDYKVSKPF